MYRCNCGKEYNNETSFDEHKKNCQNGNLSCQLCNKNIPACDMNDHLFQCSSQYDQCPICFEDFPRGFISYHVDNNCIDLVDNNTDLVTNKNPHTPSSSTFAQPMTIKSDHVNEHKREFTNLSSHRQQQTDKEQTDNGTLVSCTYCQKHIERSLFLVHLKNCAGRRNLRTENRAQSSTDSTMHKKTTLTTAENNKESNFKPSNVAGSLAEGSSDTLNTSVERLNLNSDGEKINTSTLEKPISKGSPNLILQRKPQNLRKNLQKDFYPNEIENLQFNILIIGGPRVGKSQLINTLCGDENLAKTSASLDSCTKEIKCYTMKKNEEQTPDVDPFQINFYDTPGVESWTDENGTTTMRKFIEDTNPVCIIYCASPGTFTVLKQLQQVLKFCQEKQIFCALVCTNMWSNPNRKVVVEEFEKELSFFGAPVKKQFEQQHDQSLHEVIHFGDDALCTMVNSAEYYDPEISSKKKPVQGIDELIHSIMEKLDDEKFLGWCHAVLYRRSYWEKIRQKTAGFASARMQNVAKLNNMRLKSMLKNVAYFLKKFRE